MSRDELDAYARKGKLPDWFPKEADEGREWASSKSNSKEGAWPHPANFSIGSPESRAAVRALAEGREKVDERLIVHMGLIGEEDVPERRRVDRFVNDHEKTVEIVFIQLDRTTVFNTF